jgi:endonuclease/exonuclease/phosphatase family metal-dependent hydrolase
MRRVAGLLVALLLAGAAGADATTFRFVTFNVYHGGFRSGWTGDARYLDDRLAIATGQLRALAVDVVALQEASAGRDRGNVAARLAEALGLRYVHAPASVRLLPVPLLNRLAAWIINFEEGPAILSRYPIVATETYDLPRCISYFDPRVLLRAEIATPDGPLQVFSAHTSGAACQVERVAEVVRAWRGRMPVVLMGDLNGSDTAPWVAGLARDGFVDAFRAVNPTDPGATVWQRVDGPDATVRRRVDYVLVLAGTGTTADVQASRVVLDRPGQRADGTPLWPSDHYGVLADLAIAPMPGSDHADARGAGSHATSPGAAR